MSHLRVEGLYRYFGGLAALLNVSLRLEAGERRAIIGPNGAGKSTLFNIIAGTLPPSAGRVYLNEQDITALPPARRADLGLGRTFQRNNLFAGLTVAENVRLAVQRRQGVAAHWFRAVSRYPALDAGVTATLERVGLAAERETPARQLAYGQQRALEIALALAVEPSLLLLDEPTAGMSPAETAAITRLIAALPGSLTVLLVEHDMDVVFEVADQITVLHHGQVISAGDPARVRADPAVQQVYLGAG